MHHPQAWSDIYDAGYWSTWHLASLLTTVSVTCSGSALLHPAHHEPAAVKTSEYAKACLILIILDAAADVSGWWENLPHHRKQASLTMVFIPIKATAWSAGRPFGLFTANLVCLHPQRILKPSQGACRYHPGKAGLMLLQVSLSDYDPGSTATQQAESALKQSGTRPRAAVKERASCRYRA